MFQPAPIPSNEAQRHAALLRFQLLDTGNESEFDDITNLVAEIFGAKIVLISLVDSYRQWFKSKVGLDACELDRETSFCGHAIVRREVFYIEDALADERFAGNPLVIGEPHIRTYVGAPLFSPDGFGIGTLCVIYDQVTPCSIDKIEQLRKFAQIVQNTAESRLNRLILQAERERQRQAIAIIGHEMKTPLVSLQMMQNEQGLSSIQPLGSAMVETTDHLALVMDDLVSILDPSKADQIKSARDSVFSVVERTSSSLDYLLRKSGIQYHLSGDQDSHEHCNFNVQALRQLVTNILKNAAIHSGANDIWLTIETIKRSERRISYLMKVTDNGKGVSEAHQAKLFDAGYRGDTQASGSGLGLYIAKDLVAKLEGTIRYEPSDQGGAAFVINITLEHSPIEIIENAPEIAAPDDVSILEGKRILFAEDDRTLRLLTETILKRQGAIVLSCENGQQALQALADSTYDVLLTDIQMPEVSGIELVKRVRSLGLNMPIIGLSAHQGSEEQQILIAAGADAVLEKPFDIRHLIMVLGKI